MIAYAVAVMLVTRSKLDWARVTWSLGCLFFLVHVVCAFEIHYQWSHQIAESQTAAKTEKLTGIETNVGIYVNYLFTLVWLVDTGFWWLVGSNRYSNRPRTITIAIHVLFIFMIFNGAIVFASGPARWIGVLVLAAALISWIESPRWSSP